MQNSKYFDFMKFKMIGFTLSFVFVILSFASFFTNRLSFGIDFTGGLLVDITAKSDIGELRSFLSTKSLGDFSVQSYGVDNFLLRIAQSQKQDASIDNIKGILNSYFDGKKEQVVYNKIDFVGPQVGKELIQNGIFAFTLSLFVISLYIWFRFEFNFALGVLITLLHDVIILFGIYSFFKIDFDLTSIAAILTVMGYSMNDKVVVYDRLREFMPKFKEKSLVEIINISLTSTLRRTLLTSSTTLISLLVLGLFGGDSIKYFSLVVFVGVIIGTYSSIFISAPILTYMNG